MPQLALLVISSRLDLAAFIFLELGIRYGHLVMHALLQMSGNKVYVLAPRLVSTAPWSSTLCSTSS